SSLLVFLCGRRRRGDAGEINLDDGAFTQFAFDAQMSAVLMDSAITSCEAEAASLLIDFGGEKWLEEMSFDLFAHSAARVGNLDQNVGGGTNAAPAKRGL